MGAFFIEHSFGVTIAAVHAVVGQVCVVVKIQRAKQKPCRSKNQV
jgi:hypothetical protein